MRLLSVALALLCFDCGLFPTVDQLSSANGGAPGSSSAQSSSASTASSSGAGGGSASGAGGGSASSGGGGSASTSASSAAAGGGDAGGAGGAGPLAFLDDFNRADNPLIGNGWIAKHPPAFELHNDTVVRLYPDMTEYYDNVVYRPATEDIRDVEVSVELQINGIPPGFPQVAARIQSSTIALAGVEDCYLLYLPASVTNAALARQHGSSFVALGPSLSLVPPLNTTGRYRLRLRTQGANPVQLDGWVEVFSAGAWTTLGHMAYTDTDPSRIDTAGSVGFSGARMQESSGLYAFDNFTRTPL